MVPQFPTQYPPAFQTPLPTQPFGTPLPAGPGAPAGTGPIPPWTPPIAPAPPQAHPPGGLPPNFAVAFGARRTFEFVPSLSLSEQWTDNFNQTSSNKQTNYRSTVGPGGTFIINGPTTRGTISSNAGLTYDTAPDSNNFNVFPTITASIQQTFSPRLNLIITDTYIRNDNPNYNSQFGLNTQRQTYSSNSFSAALNYLIDLVSTTAYYRNSAYYTGGSNGNNTTSNIVGLSASTPVGVLNTVSLGYEFSWSDTSGTSARTNSNSGQSTGNLVTATVARQTGLYSSVGLQGSYQQFSPPQEQDEHIWSISAFSTYGWPSGLSFSGSLGYNEFIQGSQTSSGVTSNSTLGYRFGPAFASIGVFSGFNQTGLNGQNFGVQNTQGYTGTFSYTFTPVLVGSVAATYTENSPTGAGNNSSAPNSKTFGSTANLSWQILRWLSLNGNYSYFLYSNPNDGSLTGSGSIPVNTATITLGATF
jgi:hypothetical protein